MKFEFKPSDNSLSFREYLSYLSQTSPIITIYINTIIPACLVFMFSLLTYVMSGYYIYFAYIILPTIVLITLSFLLILLIIKLIKKISIKNNTLYCDLESNFYFTISDGYLLRENEFSTVKLELSKINDVKILRQGLILSSKDKKISIFIPKDVLPVTLEEFISFLKNENSSLIVLNEFKRLKKSYKKIYILIIFTVLLSFISSFFIGKYNFKKYNLIPNSDLIKQEDNTFLYENEDIGISLTFPSNWENKFGIEELPDRINVYYLAEGKQSYNTTLLFSIRGLGSIFDNITLNIIRTDGLYIFIGPTKIDLKKNSKEHLEYLDLYKDIQNIKLQKNKYYNI